MVAAVVAVAVMAVVLSDLYSWVVLAITVPTVLTALLQLSGQLNCHNTGRIIVPAG